MYSTNLSLTGSWYKCEQISLSQDAGKDMYKSLSHSKLVQVCTVQISLTGHWHKNVQISLTGSWQKYLQISLSQEAGKDMYKSLSPCKLVQVLYVQYKSLAHWKLAQMCTNLSNTGRR